MTSSEFYARLDNIPKHIWGEIGLVSHLVHKYQGRQYRDSGEEYIEHVFDVMYQIYELGLDCDVFLAGGFLSRKFL